MFGVIRIESVPAPGPRQHLAIFLGGIGPPRESNFAKIKIGAIAPSQRKTVKMLDTYPPAMQRAALDSSLPRSAPGMTLYAVMNAAIPPFGASMATSMPFPAS